MTVSPIQAQAATMRAAVTAAIAGDTTTLLAIVDACADLHSLSLRLAATVASFCDVAATLADGRDTTEVWAAFCVRDAAGSP